MARFDREKVFMIISHCVLAVLGAVFACLGVMRSSEALDKSLLDVADLAEEHALSGKQADEGAESGPEEDGPDEEEPVKSKASGLKDGEYTGTGKGYGGPVSVKLVVEDGTIKSLEVSGASGETPAYLAMAKKIIPSIIANGNANVDGVSGATYSSNGIKQAAAEAIKKAGGDGSVDLKKAAPKVKGKNGKNSKKKKYEKPEGGWKDGTYTGSAKGFGGTVSATVTIKNGKITKISATGNGETSSYWNRAQAVKGRIIKKQNPRVDAVSGATYSSNGIINAVIAALNKAGKKGPKDQSITISEESYEITCGESALLKAKAKTKLSYTSSDDSVVKVSSKGKITGVSGGKAKITITAKKTAKYKKAVKKVTVAVNKKEQKITISGYSSGSVIEFTTADTGKTLSLAGTSESGKALTYSSDNESAASIDGQGTVTVKGEGTAKITITAPETSVYEAASVWVKIKVTKEDAPPDTGDKINGTFTGSGRGYGGAVTAVVEIADSVITKITVEGKKETNQYWLKAKKIVPKMVSAQTWDVDAISGATYSSNGIRDAVKQALEEAGL